MQRFKPGIIDYDGPMATHYAAGRALSPQAAETWRLTVERYIPDVRNLTILDLGSGTGRFATFLSQAFAARVIGVEPSDRMRGVALQDPGANVELIAGTAECIPTGDAACDVVWMSQVWHHVRDQNACAKEIRRVLRGAGVVLIRGAFASSAAGFPTILQYFPGIVGIFDDLPTIPETISVFAAQGFALEAQLRVPQQICASLQEFADRTRLRADTSLALLSDEEFFACQGALEVAAGQEDPVAPIVETVDLLVFRAADSATPLPPA